MLIKYLVSSPYGDITVSKEKLLLPLDGDPLKTPYENYFSSIYIFIQNKLKSILKILSEKFNRIIFSKDIKEVLIRAEKHGFFYHPASVEFIIDREKIKFGVNVAISEIGKKWLKEEFKILKELNQKFNPSYLPKVYFSDEINYMQMVFIDWFEDYHEFHLSKNEEEKQILTLWDFNQGYRVLSKKQAFEIYKQAAKILTYYYDIENFNQIYPWHHAAGDFVAKVEDERIDVRLTTVRKYEPVIVFYEKNCANILIALFYFFLDLTLRMRIDRLDGVGEILWADDYCLYATVEGFFDALKSKTDLNKFLCLLKSFNLSELKLAFEGLIKLYEGKEEYFLITKNLEEHIKKLHTILQTLL
ncbi:MAG: hypothetical protein LWW95_07540 [Candidatus Desulfofervidus auxilii]|nr:hypothetical protein [Candidatus Desulfofervidus auxilii]